MNKKVVYTAITNDYDVLKIPDIREDGVDYICFTDNKQLKSDFWDVQYIENLDHKMPKILPHIFIPQYEYSLWIDGSVQLHSTISEMIPFLGENHIATFSAKMWQCAYYEAETCKRLNLDSAHKIDTMVHVMRSCNYPENNGLSACTVILRTNSVNTVALSTMWYGFVSYFTKRDQISYNFCLWSLNMKQSFLPGNVYDNTFLTWNGAHKR